MLISINLMINFFVTLIRIQV